ncbi:hypothetical protein C8R44DRAFT_725800 [Mycena epipterygia]|nr:hypothetical protein C8R44DRAFT_725800 [Mycena epipterygia]
MSKLPPPPNTATYVRASDCVVAANLTQAPVRICTTSGRIRVLSPAHLQAASLRASTSPVFTRRSPRSPQLRGRASYFRVTNVNGRPIVSPARARVPASRAILSTSPRVNHPSQARRPCKTRRSRRRSCTAAPRFTTRYSGGIFLDGYTRDAIQPHDIVEIKNAKKDKYIVAHEIESPTHEALAPSKGETLHNLVKRMTSSKVETGLLGLILSPLKYDAELNTRTHAQRDSAGTDAGNVGLLAYAYLNKYNTVLARSYPTKPSTRRAGCSPTPNANEPVEEDLRALYRAGEEDLGTNKRKFYEILTGRHREHLMQLKLGQRAPRAPLDRLRRTARPRHPDINPQDLRDAMKIEKTMGRKSGLVMRLGRTFKRGFCARTGRLYKKELVECVEGKTSGAFADLLVALIEGPDRLLE